MSRKTDDRNDIQVKWLDVEKPKVRVIGKHVKGLGSKYKTIIWTIFKALVKRGPQEGGNPMMNYYKHKNYFWSILVIFLIILQNFLRWHGISLERMWRHVCNLKKKLLARFWWLTQHKTRIEFSQL